MVVVDTGNNSQGGTASVTYSQEHMTEVSRPDILKGV